MSSKCKICGLSNIELLVASHIKPWSKSIDEEKLDCNNGFLLCPNHDALFDGGFISFDDEGNILISKRLTEEDLKLLHLDKNIKIDISEKNKKYLEYHREFVFKR
ncbi:MAG: HNH endonuclease [Fusobacterium perfoetens]|uniref:HNH endonuclease n=1 Tax=Fusobacterium perfoetens TaxID=852 RepID=UPI0023F41441|nr:HNH endonuclease signature motif containing protein [Fusobacterium perfoetens]MCI6152936.1 HNH endonuclease [Fusobacterium perfoetens]MDY3237348.1 HNH endonuclease signature motif containing protein [Fusobacterium perfoetens]